MHLRTVSRAAGIVGGLCWLVRYVLDAAGSGSGTVGDVLYWIGLALLFAALSGLGSELVSSSALWLQAIVGIAFPLLVWSVLEVLAPGSDPAFVDAAFGGVLLALCGAQLLKARRSRERREPRRRHGSHAR